MLLLGAEAGLDWTGCSRWGPQLRLVQSVGTMMHGCCAIGRWASAEWGNWASRFLFCRESPKVTAAFLAPPKAAVNTDKMFARPRPKKDALQPPPKKRKTTHAIEEITFDRDARADYLSGFHKRKVARIKEAQSIAAKKEREERIQIRKQV